MGDDLAIWNQIKDNGEIAHFLEQSDFITPDSKKKEELLGMIDDLTAKYPDAQLAQQLKSRREVYSAKVVKRKAMLEKAKVKSN